MSKEEDAPIPETKPLGVSVVIATYNRAKLLPILLQALANQTLVETGFEVILVDDGSSEPVRPIIDSLSLPYPLELLEQSNAGQAAARDRGVRRATGDVVVIVDDDMELGPDFLANHLAWHNKGYSVVLGRIQSAPHLDRMPLFERFHAQQLDKYAASFRRGSKPRGVHMCTGNVSFRRKDYLAIGGFDSELKRSEDRDLGIRLEQSGAPFVFGDDTVSVHASDHASLDVWLKRAFNYGVYDAMISAKHPGVDNANPWQFLFLVNPVSRPLLLIANVCPNVGKGISSVAWMASEWCDARGLSRLALQGVTLVYGLEYYRGMRHWAGSMRHSLQSLRRCIRTRRASVPSEARAG